MICKIENIPFFWKERIETLNTNKDFIIKKNHIDHDLLYLKNPFLNENKYKMYLTNLKRLLLFLAKKIIIKTRI